MQIEMSRLMLLKNTFVRCVHCSLPLKRAVYLSPQRLAFRNHSRGTVSRQSEWLRSKSLQAINAGEGVEKREPSYTVGGNAN